MIADRPITRKIGLTGIVLLVGLIISICMAVAWGVTGGSLRAIWEALQNGPGAGGRQQTILWRIRLPRALMAAELGATLSLGGLVFQALLRNALAEPYILGISGGAAVGAIWGIMLGLARYPGVAGLAFAGSLAIMGLVIYLASGRQLLRKDSLLLAGVMVNAFCSAVILFLISRSQDFRLHQIMFWLMGDLSLADMGQVGRLALVLGPCFIALFLLSHAMNLLTMGTETAQALGLRVKTVMVLLLVVTSLMISASVAHCGLVGFVGLVMPHVLRLVLGPDHRVLVPACLFGGGAYLVLCDLTARVVSQQGEMPVGVVTALIGAPVFIYLLRRTRN